MEYVPTACQAFNDHNIGKTSLLSILTGTSSLDSS